MRFSLIQQTTKNMYIYNAFGFVAPAPVYDMEAFVEPDGFDPTAQDFNIISAFASYPDATKKYIYSVSQDATITGILDFVNDRNHYYSENDSAYILTLDNITWTAGSTHRHVIVCDASSSIDVALPLSAIWFYGRNINHIKCGENSKVKYIHLESLNSLTTLNTMDEYGSFDLLGNLTIPSTISSIPDFCFCACRALNGTLVLPSTMTSIADYAFYQCPFTKINCHAITPPILGDPAFNGVNTSVCELHVPAGSKTAYQAAYNWNVFTHIIEDL